MKRCSLSSVCPWQKNQPCRLLLPEWTAIANGANSAKCQRSAAWSSVVPLSNSTTRNRRGPVFSSVCSEIFPAFVRPVRADIGDGTIRLLDGSLSEFFHVENGRVANSELLLPTHNSGSGVAAVEKSISRISSVAPPS